ncbi:MAG: hypothetical protein ACREDH_16040 [Methylocella sp.]
MLNERGATRGMILEYDENLEQLVKNFTLDWTEIRLRKRDYSNVDENSFVTGAVLLAGGRSLLCCMTTKDFGDDLWDYYPIYLKEVDESNYASDEWVTLACANGTSDLDRKLQWLFEMPSLSLTEGVESFTDWPPKEDSKETSFCFYNGLEVKDPKGRGSLRITASENPDFIVTLNFSF